MSKKDTFQFQKTFEGTYLPERLGYLCDRRSKKMLGLFFTKKGLEVTDKLLTNSNSDKFQFKKVNGGIALESIGRLLLGDGSIVRIFFTPDGLKMILPKKSKNIAYYKEKKTDSFGFTPSKKEKLCPTTPKNPG